MRCALPSGVDQQILRPLREAERRALQRRVRLGRPRRPVRRRRRPRERRLVAEAAGAIDRAEQDLQEVQHPAGLEAVGMRRDAAHGVHRHRAADGLVVAAAGAVGPRNVERDLLLEGGVRQLARDAPDGRRPGSRSPPRPCPGRIRRPRNRSAISAKLGRALRPSGSLNVPTSAGAMSVRVASASAPVVLSKASGLPSSSRANRPSSAAPGSSITSQCALVKRTRYSRSIFCGAHQFMDQRADEQAIGARPDADPLVGDRAVAGADRIDGDDLDALLLELAERDLERVGGVVFGHAEQHEVAACAPSPARRTPRTSRRTCRARPPPC